MNRIIPPFYQDEFCTLYCGEAAVFLPLLEPCDLLLTDPPYGIGEKADKSRNISSRKWKHAGTTRDYGLFSWDSERISQWLIDQAIEKCSKAIIFGGNYYDLGPAKCWLVWDKDNSGDFADCELAWTNLNQAVRIYRHLWNGMCRKHNEERFHPTQKPLDVMSWCIGQAGEIQSILDPFCGSGTTLVAAKLHNLKVIGIEREECYCEIAVQRLVQDVLDFRY